MRAFFSRSLMPAIHYSSYDAGEAVRIPLGEGLDPHVVGFMEQVEMVNVGLQAVLDRAIKERHQHGDRGGAHGARHADGAGPMRVQEALVLPMVVAVRDPELHRSHFLVRERETSGRRRGACAICKGFEEIRKIQDFILERAAGGGHARWSTT